MDSLRERVTRCRIAKDLQSAEALVRLGRYVEALRVICRAMGRAGKLAGTRRGTKSSRRGKYAQPCGSAAPKPPSREGRRREETVKS